jgi:hypothetical protein
MVLSVDPVVVLHVIGAESSAASVPERWATFAVTSPQVHIFSFALTVGFSTAAFHLAFAVWNSEILLLGTFCVSSTTTETITAAAATLLCIDGNRNSAAGMNRIFGNAVGWCVLLLSLTTHHGHWCWGHSIINRGGRGGCLLLLHLSVSYNFKLIIDFTNSKYK